MSNTNTYVRFEMGQEDRVGEDLGPFPFVQLTYEALRVGPEGDDLAFYDGHVWKLKDGTVWTDVVIFGESK